MKRALVIGAESRGYQNVFLGLTRAECAPFTAPDIPTAAQLLTQERADVVVLDLALFSNGVAEVRSFLEARRGETPPCPVLGLSPVPEPDALATLSEVDDFILPPFRPSEVSLRVGLLLRRFSPRDQGEVIRSGPLVIDLARYEATLDGNRLDLTFKEYELLRFLAASPGNVFTRETLLNKVWGYDYFGGTRTVDVHIRRLRSKIETTMTFIETVRNVGYRFREP
jgi:DNA-binding response OmpR family regulator